MNSVISSTVSKAYIDSLIAIIEKDLKYSDFPMGLFVDCELWDLFEQMCLEPKYKGLLLKDFEIKDNIENNTKNKTLEVDKNGKILPKTSVWTQLIFYTNTSHLASDFLKKALQSSVFIKERSEIMEALIKRIDFKAKGNNKVGYYPCFEIVKSVLWGEELKIHNFKDATEFLFNFIYPINEGDFLFIKTLFNDIFENFVTNATSKSNKNLLSKLDFEKLSQMHKMFLSYSTDLEFNSYVDKLFNCCGIEKVPNEMQIDFLNKLQNETYYEYLNRDWETCRDWKLKESKGVKYNIARLTFIQNWINLQRKLGLDLTVNYRGVKSLLGEEKYDNKAIIKFLTFCQSKITKDDKLHIFWTLNSHNDIEEVTNFILKVEDESENKNKIFQSVENNLFYLPLIMECGTGKILLKVLESALKKQSKFWDEVQVKHQYNIANFFQYVAYQTNINPRTEIIAHSMILKLAEIKTPLIFYPFQGKNRRGELFLKTCFGFEYMFQPKLSEKETNPYNITVFKEAYCMNKNFFEETINHLDDKLQKALYENLIDAIIGLNLTPNLYHHKNVVISKSDLENILKMIAIETPQFFNKSLPYIRKYQFFRQPDNQRLLEKLELLVNNQNTKKVVVL